MNLRRVWLVVLGAIGFVLVACATPPPLSPEAASVTVDDGRSIEHCTALGVVSATLPTSTLTSEPEKFLTPMLRDRTAGRSGNYLETTPLQCERHSPCAKSGVAYRCPDSSTKVI